MGAIAAKLETNSGDSSERLVMITEEISDTIVSEIIRKIYEYNSEDEENEKKKVGYTRKPIRVIINSYGGSAYDGFGIAAAIHASKTPVHTICVGYAMSAALVIFASGHVRFIYDISTLMYHQVAGWSFGKLEDIKKSVEEMERLQKIYDDKILSLSNVTREQLTRYREKKENWYIPADEAIKLGLADEILTR